MRRHYPISKYLSDIAGCGVSASVYLQANWAKNAFEEEVAYVQHAADHTGFRKPSSAMPSFSSMTCDRNATA